MTDKIIFLYSCLIKHKHDFTLCLKLIEMMLGCISTHRPANLGGITLKYSTSSAFQIITISLDAGHYTRTNPMEQSSWEAGSSSAGNGKYKRLLPEQLKN